MNMWSNSDRIGRRHQLALRVIKELIRLPKGSRLVIVSGTEEEANALLEEVKRVSKKIGLDTGDFDWQLNATNKRCQNTT